MKLYQALDWSFMMAIGEKQMLIVLDSAYTEKIPS